MTNRHSDSSNYPGTQNTPARHDRLLQEQYDDPYRSKQKLKQPAICKQCKAVYHKGHWTLENLPDKDMAAADQVTCPACQRIHDNVPAAFLTISGNFFLDHQDEINSLINNRVDQEYQLHPLKRIMSFEDKDSSHLYTFTDAHLARDIGQALERAYSGELDLEYSKHNALLRVSWKRDNSD